MTYRFAKGSDVIPAVMSPVIFAFLTSVRVVRFPSELSSVEARELRAVDSICRVVRPVSELNDAGKSPAIRSESDS